MTDSTDILIDLYKYHFSHLIETQDIAFMDAKNLDDIQERALELASNAYASIEAIAA